MAFGEHETQSAALWASQMLFHIARNLVSLGVAPVEGLLTNVEEAREHLTRHFPDHGRDFDGLAEEWRNGLELAENLRRESAGPAPSHTLHPQR